MPQIQGGVFAKQPKRPIGWIDIGGDTVKNNGQNVEREMRFFQKRIYKNFRHEQNVIVQHPGGSGKSTAIAFVFGKKVHDCKKQKTLIVVPQQLISKSFLPPKDQFGNAVSFFLKYPDRTRLQWNLTNLCDDINDSKTAILRDWMLNDRYGNGIEDAVVVTTYHALIMVWNSFSEREKKQAIRNTAFVMDEAHRIMYQDDNEYTQGETNCIGDMIKFLVSSRNKNTYLWLTTATFIRGDSASILPPAIYNKFAKDYLPLDEYWCKSIKHIKTFSYDFIVYKTDPHLEIRELMRRSIGKKTLIYCPRQGSIHGDKYEFKDKIVRTIKRLWKGVDILDLVEEKGRSQKKKDFIDGVLKPDVVLSVDLMNEGVDWVECEQILDVTPSNSLTRHLQKNMRLWRDCVRKKHIAHYIFFQFNKKVLNEEGYTRKLNEIFALWTASMIIDEQLCPINVSSVGGKQRNSQKRGPWINPFKEAFPDLNLQTQVLADVAKQLAMIYAIEQPTVLEELDCITWTVQGFLPNEDEEVIEDIASYIYRVFERKSQFKGRSMVSIVDKGFSKVTKGRLGKGILSFTSNACGIDTWSELRKCFGDTKTIDEWVKIAEQLAEQNGWDGKLTGGVVGFTDDEIEMMRAEYEAQKA